MAKRGIIDHPKILRLGKRLKMDKCCAVGVMECLWQWAARYCQSGDLSDLPPDEIADAIQWTGDADLLWDALVECRFIDVDGDRKLIHGWSEHADDALHMALARKGKTFADGTMPRMHRLSVEEKRRCEALYAESVIQSDGVRTESAEKRMPCAQDAHAVRTALALSLSPVPPPGEAYIVPDVLGSNTPLPPKQEPGEASATPPKALKRPPAGWEKDFDDLRSAYPARSGDLGIAKARESFAKLLVAGVAPAAIIDGAREYAAWAVQTHNAGTQFVKQLSTWLSRRGWEERYVLPPPQAMSRGSPNGHRPEALSLDEQHRQLMADYEAKYGKIGGDDN